MRRTQLIRQLVLDSQYVVDEAALADAIVARGTARRLVGGITFRNDVRRTPVRSFRMTTQARSFRPSDQRTQRRARNAIDLGRAAG
jgi:hypothetical protein